MSLRCLFLCDLCKPVMRDMERENEKLRNDLEAAQRASEYTHREYVRLANSKRAS
jgi:hypothetical protein